MASTSYNDAKKKIMGINKEIDDQTLELIKSRRKRVKILLSLLLAVIVGSLIALVTLVVTGHIKLFGEDTPTRISLYSATANEKGILQIMVDVNDFGDAKSNANFFSIKARITDMANGAVYVEDIIPIYLGNNKVRILINDPDLVLLPGLCNIQLRLVGKQKLSNVVTISKIIQK